MNITRRWQLEWLPWWGQTLIALLALLIGVILARLPLLWASILLLTGVLILLTLIDPLYGITIALVLGPSKPLTDYFVPTLPLDLGQIALIVTLGAWFLHAAHRRVTRIPDTPFTLPLLAFLAAGLMSMVGALSLGYALKEMIKWAQLLLMLWLVIDLAGARRWWIVIAGVLLAASLEALIGVWQFGLRGDGPEHFLILDGRFYRAYGTFEQPNPYAGFMGLVLPISVGLALGALEAWLRPMIAAWRASSSIERWNRAVSATMNEHLPKLLVFGACAGLLFAALIMSWSRGAWLGFGAALAVMLFAWPRKAWRGAALVIGTILAILFLLQAGLMPSVIADRATGFSEFVQSFDVRGQDITSDNYAVLERLAHWQAAESMARYNFWFGVGIGNYEPVYPAFSLINWPYPLGHAHNIYLNTLAEMGIIGLAAYIFLWAAIFWQTWAVTRSADLWMRSTAIGLIGTWTHLSVHSLLDKLYVANLHLHIGALLGVLSILIAIRQGRQYSGDGN
jgi:putative inorganic carbon (hco3(-)) transporter